MSAIEETTTASLSSIDDESARGATETESDSDDGMTSQEISSSPRTTGSGKHHDFHSEGFFKLSRRKRKELQKSTGNTEEKLKETLKLLKTAEKRLQHFEESNKEKDKKLARAARQEETLKKQVQHEKHLYRASKQLVIGKDGLHLDVDAPGGTTGSNPNSPSRKRDGGSFGRSTSKKALKNEAMDLEAKLNQANAKLKELTERSEERVNQLTLLLKDAETKAAKARDITTRALERVTIADREKKQMERKEKAFTGKLKFLDDDLNAIESALTSLRDVSKQTREKLITAKKRLVELGDSPSEEDEDEDDEGEGLWAFITEALDRLKAIKAQEAASEDDVAVPAESVEASPLGKSPVPIESTGAPKEGFVDALRMVVLEAQERVKHPDAPLDALSTNKRDRSSVILGANGIPQKNPSPPASPPQGTSVPSSSSSSSSTPPSPPPHSLTALSPPASSSTSSSSSTTTDLPPLEPATTIIVTPADETENPEEEKKEERSKSTRQTLKVVVFEARGLRWTEVDPYCSVNVGTTKKSTNVLSQCADDVWNETFVFDLGDEKEVTIDCLNKPGKSPGDPFLGHVTISIETLTLDTPMDGWFPMEKQKEDDPDVRGDLLVSVEKKLAEQSPAPARPGGISKKRIERQTSLSGMVKMMVNHAEGGDDMELPSPNASVASQSGLNPVQLAASAPKPDLDQIALLLEKGQHKTPAGWVNDRQQSLVHLMAMRGNPKHLAIVLTPQVDLQQKDMFGFTALHLAAVKATVECIRLLLTAGADVNVEDAYNKLTPLHHAALGGNHHAIKLLIGKGGRVDHADRNQATPLLKAAYGGHIKCLKALLSAGAAINAADNEGNTAFLVACLEGRFEAAVYLKKKGANTAVSNVMGDTPLWCAIRHNNLTMTKALLKDVEVNQTMGRFKLGVLHRAMLQIEEPQLCDKLILPLLLKRGLKVDAQNVEGKTPLFYAAFFKKIEAMKLLIRNGANVRVRDKAGNTVLHFASSPEAVNLIVEALPKEIITKEVNVQNNQGNSPLHAAYVFYGDSVVQVLKQFGADEEAKNANGNTPSQVAWAAVKKVLLPFFPEDEAMPDCGGLYISKVN